MVKNHQFAKPDTFFLFEENNGNFNFGASKSITGSVEVLDLQKVCFCLMGNWWFYLMF